MLSKAKLLGQRDAAIVSYLHGTLGVAPKIGPWRDTGSLPYFLHDAFDLREVDLFGHSLLLAVELRSDRAGSATVRAEMDQLRHAAGVPVVYVTRALASYQRRQLIVQKVPFLVPGNQLYLPDLGIDLREHFPKPPLAAPRALSPSTQAMLIALLLRRPWRSAWQSAEMAGELGYTPMTVSRAVRELTATGIVNLRTQGRVRWLETDRTAEQFWEVVKPLLRSPVKRRAWVLTTATSHPSPSRPAGLSALAGLSMLAEPRWPTYAVTQTEWNAALRMGYEQVHAPLPGACEWEVWSYSTALAPGTDAVDPLSLMLSLQADGDERVQLALDGLKEHLPW